MFGRACELSVLVRIRFKRRLLVFRGQIDLLRSLGQPAILIQLQWFAVIGHTVEVNFHLLYATAFDQFKAATSGLIRYKI